MGMISVVVTTFNEAEKLISCLESVKNFADEIVIIDLGSSDNVKEVCEKFKARIYYHKRVGYVETVRNYATDMAKGDWILVLDPDEQIHEELKNKLKEISKQKKYQAVNIPRKNIFFGKWISHTNWWPDRHVRFFKKGKVKWSDKIHDYPVVDGELIELEEREELAIIHNGYKSVNEFLSRQNRYSSIEAENMFKDGVRFSWILFFWKPTREFLVRFIKHFGFLDGFIGFVLTDLMMVYQLQVMIKLWEKRKEK